MEDSVYVPSKLKILVDRSIVADMSYHETRRYVKMSLEYDIKRIQAEIDIFKEGVNYYETRDEKDVIPMHLLNPAKTYEDELFREAEIAEINRAISVIDINDAFRAVWDEVFYGVIESRNYSSVKLKR